MSSHAQLLSVRLLFLLMALAALLLLSSNRVGAEEPLRTTEYVVVTGDTLWDIAAGLTDPGESVRETVVVLRDINQLTTTDLSPGQRLVVPTD